MIQVILLLHLGSRKRRKEKTRRKTEDSLQSPGLHETLSEVDRVNEGISASKRKKIVPHPDGKYENSDVQGFSFDGDNGYEEVPKSGAVPRKRLYFPNNLQMDYNSKVQWTFKLYKARPAFEVLFKEGNYREYVTVKDEIAVEHLTTEGFDGVVLEKPSEEGRTTEVIIFGIPLCLDADHLLTNERIVKATRREVKSGGKVFPKPQLIALLKGDVPEKIFVPCLGYKKVALFEEQVPLCFKCSKCGGGGA